MDLGNKFDLDAARKHADTGGLMNTTKWLHAALDEIERLRSENRELKKTDVWANDVIKEHESLNARIKALEAEAQEYHDKKEEALTLCAGQNRYIERLEAAFLRSNAAMRYYQEGNRGPWPQLGEKFKEPYQEKAREALERIKEDGKDEEL